MGKPPLPDLPELPEGMGPEKKYGDLYGSNNRTTPFKDEDILYEVILFLLDARSGSWNKVLTKVMYAPAGLPAMGLAFRGGYSGLHRFPGQRP